MSCRHWFLKKPRSPEKWSLYIKIHSHSNEAVAFETSLCSYTLNMYLWLIHSCRQGRKTSGPHLAEAALAQHHQEVKIGQLHAILVAIGVEPGCSVGWLAFCVLAWADLGPLDERKREQGTASDTSSRTQTASGQLADTDLQYIWALTWIRYNGAAGDFRTSIHWDFETNNNILFTKEGIDKMWNAFIILQTLTNMLLIHWKSR